MDIHERGFFSEPFSDEELRSVIGDRSPSDVFSWKSPSFRKLGVDRESLSDDQLVSLMLDEPRLIRRPLIQVGGELIIGADTQALQRAFP